MTEPYNTGLLRAVELLMDTWSGQDILTAVANTLQPRSVTEADKMYVANLLTFIADHGDERPATNATLCPRHVELYYLIRKPCNEHYRYWDGRKEAWNHERRFATTYQQRERMSLRLPPGGEWLLLLPDGVS